MKVLLGCEDATVLSLGSRSSAASARIHRGTLWQRPGGPESVNPVRPHSCRGGDRVWNGRGTLGLSLLMLSGRREIFSNSPRVGVVDTENSFTVGEGPLVEGIASSSQPTVW
jgi:hypothetical protein